MNKSDQYYFTDSIFQLELNLHNIRRQLIFMIEEFEKQDCIVCLQLKCRCVGKSPEKDTSLISTSSLGNKSNDNTPNKAPPADSLPKPKFEKGVEILIAPKEENKDIETWIEASKTRQAKSDRRLETDVLLTSLKTWGESRNEVKKNKNLGDFEKDRIVLDTRLATANAVEMFFNRFKAQPLVTATNMAYITNVAAIYGKEKTRSSEYTYF